MKKVLLRSAVAQSAHSHEHFAALWSATMWALALVYLLAKVPVH